MRIAALETFPVSVPYRRPEATSFATFNGVSNVIVKVTADNGLVGWGESVTLCDAAGVQAAIETARPFVVGRDPWNKDAIADDFFRKGAWQFRAMTGNFAFSGIDMALWDLCGKAVGEPVYRLLGGALRSEVDYFYYLLWQPGTDAEADIREQCRDGVARGYSVFYLKVGVDPRLEERLLVAVREEIGADRKIRIDANQAWSVPEAAALLNRWQELVGLDFAEAPVPIEPHSVTLDLKSRTTVPICANEGCWGQTDVAEIIVNRVADYLCFHTGWVGSMRRFMTLAHMAALYGLQVCKHSHPELGLSAAAGQHLMLAAPNVVDGSQQHGRVLADDVVAAPVPTASGPRWPIDSAPGLGVDVDEERLEHYAELYRTDGPLLIMHLSH